MVCVVFVVFVAFVFLAAVVDVGAFAVLVGVLIFVA